MYRIFILESGKLSMLPEGPFTTQDEALTFGKAEVGPPFVVLEVHDDHTKPQETGWMRVYHDGVHLGDTPLARLTDGSFTPCDGSYGLLEHLQSEDFPDYQDVCHMIEADALELFKTDRCAMLRRFGYCVVYIPGDEQSI